MMFIEDSIRMYCAYNESKSEGEDDKYYEKWKKIIPGFFQKVMPCYNWIEKWSKLSKPFKSCEHTPKNGGTTGVVVAFLPKYLLVFFEFFHA